MSGEKEPIGYGRALWLMPEEPMFSVLAGKISSLSREYSTPLFEPHVTLLAGITLPEKEAFAKSVALAGCLKRFSAELGDIGYSGEYFRCLFVNIVPDDSIVKAHGAAQEVFAFRDGPAYMPHLSLLYGKLGIETKKRITVTHGDLSGRTIEVGCLALYRVSGTPHEWGCVRKFDLG